MTLPPGRGRLAISPEPIGLPACNITIGIAPVACRAAVAAATADATMTSTLLSHELARELVQALCVSVRIAIFEFGWSAPVILTDSSRR